MPSLTVVHSFGRGTGKSQLAANLAVLLAGRGLRVALVDADLATPGQHILFRLDEAALACTLNDVLQRGAEPARAATDVTAGLGGAGRLWVVPARPSFAEAPRLEPLTLNGALDRLRQALAVDCMLVDTHAGLTEETLETFAVADRLLVVLRHAPRDYQGTAVVVDVARKLEVPRIALVVNQLSNHFDLAEARTRVATTYGCPVAGVLPFSEEWAALGGATLFGQQYPAHPITGLLAQLAETLLTDEALSKGE